MNGPLIPVSSEDFEPPNGEILRPGYKLPRHWLSGNHDAADRWTPHSLYSRVFEGVLVR